MWQPLSNGWRKGTRVEVATETVKRPILEADKEVSSGPMRPYLGKIKACFGKHREILLNQKGCQFESTLG